MSEWHLYGGSPLGSHPLPLQDVSPESNVGHQPQLSPFSTTRSIDYSATTTIALRKEDTAQRSQRRIFAYRNLIHTSTTLSAHQFSSQTHFEQLSEARLPTSWLVATSYPEIAM